MIGLPTLAQSLDGVNGAELARKAGTTRTLVHRLKRGEPLRDRALIVPIADALGIDLATFSLIVAHDARRSP